MGHKAKFCQFQDAGQEECAEKANTSKHHEEDADKENSFADEKYDIDEYTKCKLHLSKSNGLKIGHLNVRSIINKMDEVRFILSETKLDIFCVSRNLVE